MTRRRTPEEREADRRAWEARHAQAWLLGALPDDADMRAYVFALGSLYFVQRQIHRWTREADRAVVEHARALAALKEARANLDAWTGMLEAHALAADDARGRWRAAEWRAANPRDDDEHVWEWYRCKYTEPRRR